MEEKTTEVLLQDSVKAIEEALKGQKDEPLEITIEGDKPASPEPTEEKQERSKKTHTPFHKRIGELTSEKKKYEQLAYQMAAENDRLLKVVKEKDQFAADQYRTGLEIKIAALKDVQEDAINSGDTKKQIEAQELLAKYNANLSILERDREQAELYETEEQYQEPQYEPQNQDVNPYLEEFVAENPWCNQNSPDYDPYLAQEAVQTCNVLEKQLKLAGKRDLIGTREFFDSVKRAMYASNGLTDDMVQEQPTESYREPYQPPQRRVSAPSPIAPVSRNYQGGQPQNTAPRSVYLSEFEKDIAKRMIYDNKNLTEDQKIRRFAENKWKLEQQKGR